MFSACGTTPTPQPASADPAVIRLREEARLGQACADREDPIEIFAPKPEYTSSLRSRRLQGVVIMEGIILTSGSVAEIRVLKAGHPDLAQQAVSAFKTYRYTPGTCSGVPVPRFVVVTHTFSLP
jgi:TonB family protein